MMNWVLSQNKKIAISAIAVFLISFSFMMFFLEHFEGEELSTDVMHSDTEHSEAESHEAEKEPESEGPGNNYKEMFAEDYDKVFSIDSSGKFVYLSDDFCDLIGLDKENLADENLFDYIDSRDLPEFVSHYTKILQDHENRDGHGPFRMKNGDDILLLMFSARTVLNEDEHVSEMIFAVRDITGQVEEMTEESDKDEDGARKHDDNLMKESQAPVIKEMDYDKSRLMVDKISFHWNFLKDAL